MNDPFARALKVFELLYSHAAKHSSITSHNPENVLKTLEGFDLFVRAVYLKIDVNYIPLSFNQK